MITVTVSDMIAALSALPPGAKLAVTQEGYYSYGEDFAEVFLPKALDGQDNVYSIGHSDQNY